MKTVEEVATMLNVNPTYIRRLCRLGMIRSAKIGRDWVILDVTKEAIQNYFAAQKKLLKTVKAKKYIKLKTKIVYRVRKKKSNVNRRKAERPTIKRETWEDRTPAQRKWDEE